MVTQHFTLVPTLTVAENIVLGYTKSFRIHLPDLEQSVADAARKFGVQVNPRHWYAISQWASASGWKSSKLYIAM
jgi:ABC-type uncharacterized transport system ATPase subunit